MSRKQCKRKHYAVGGNVVNVAIRRASYIGDDMLAELGELEGKALSAFMDGTATVENWRTLADIVNVAETMSDHGIGPEVLVAAEDLQKHLLDAKDRYERTKRMGLTGPGLQSVRNLLEFHQLQRTAVPLGRYMEMVTATYNRIRSAHPRVKVLT